MFNRGINLIIFTEKELEINGIKSMLKIDHQGKKNAENSQEKVKNIQVK